MKQPDINRLFEEILAARERVYTVGDPTPLQHLELPTVDADVWVKREDLSPIKAYKWRGAYNAMASLSVSTCLSRCFRALSPNLPKSTRKAPHSVSPTPSPIPVSSLGVCFLPVLKLLLWSQDLHQASFQSV